MTLILQLLIVAVSFISAMPSVVLGQSKTNLYSKPEPSPSPSKLEKRNASGRAERNMFQNAHGNLDSEVKPSGSGEGAIILPSIKTPNTYTKLKTGEVFEAELPETIIALPDMKVPVRAFIRRGEHKGSVLIGEASLERNTKRVLIDLKSIRPNGGSDEYDLTASAMDLSGALGVEGEYNSQELKLFSAEFFLNLVSGWSDASISRDKNAWGTYQDVPGTDTQAKKAVGEATSKAAERFAEKVRSAPAYSILRGPLLVQVMVLR